MEHAFADITDLEMSDDNLLASELSVGNGLPEFDPADVLGLHADDDDAFEEEMWSAEGCNDEVADADADNAIHLHVDEAIEAILRLSSCEVVSPLQEQLHNEMPATTKADDYTTSEMVPRDDAQTTGEIDFYESDFDYDSDDSRRWSMEVNPPDAAEWCMSHVPDWEAGFSAWCSVHQGQAVHQMLPHCTIQCTTCLATFSLTSDGFWFSQN